MREVRELMHGECAIPLLWRRVADSRVCHASARGRPTTLHRPACLERSNEALSPAQQGVAFRRRRPPAPAPLPRAGARPLLRRRHGVLPQAHHAQPPRDPAVRRQAGVRPQREADVRQEQRRRARRREPAAIDHQRLRSARRATGVVQDDHAALLPAGGVEASASGDESPPGLLALKLITRRSSRGPEP